MTKKKAITGAILGNIVEYYDFGIYAIFAGMIGSSFFPVTSEFLQLLLAFSVFSCGFLMRPFGGVIFGYIGDRFGRKIALNISIGGMAFATLVIAILPSYTVIGMFAPLILILARLIQGTCIGGEGSGSAIFILEHLGKSILSLVGTIVMASNTFGTLLATLVGLFIDKFIGLNDFTWRYSFFFGGALGLVASYFRLQSTETPIFHQIKKENRIQRGPLITVLRNKPHFLFLVVAIAGLSSAMSYMIRGYFITFFTYTANYDISEALYFTSLALVYVILLLPIFSFISLKFGYFRFLQMIAILIIASIVPIFASLANINHDMFNVHIGILLMSMLTAAVSAPAYPYALKSFPPELRYSGVAFGWNIGNALFGGTTPIIATILAEQLGSHAPAYYLVVVASLFLTASAIARALLRLVFAR